MPHCLCQPTDPSRRAFQQPDQPPASTGRKACVLQNLHQLGKVRRPVKRPLGNGLAKSQSDGLFFGHGAGKPFGMLSAYRLHQQKKILIRLGEKHLTAFRLQSRSRLVKRGQITAVHRLAQPPQRFLIHPVLLQSLTAGLHVFLLKAAQSQQADDLEYRVQCICNVHLLSSSPVRPWSNPAFSIAVFLPVRNKNGAAPKCRPCKSLSF